MLIEQNPEWKTPELIVLVRSRPEEAVLTACKGDGKATSNAKLFNQCKRASNNCNQTCNTIGVS